MKIGNVLKIIGALVILVWVADSMMTIWYEQPRPDLKSTTQESVRYAGVIHVHSRYSDGSGTIEQIIRAAHTADLDFLVMTDHSTLQPLIDGYQGYHNDLLVLIGEEVNTSAGHLLALGLDHHVEQQGDEGLPALLDSIDSAGGLAILAHPAGRRPWTAWPVRPVHGIEILNADTAWRDDHPLEWIRVLLFLWFMPEGALNSLIDRPDEAINRWQTLAQQQHLVGIGSVDAHARIPLWGDQSLQFPSYARMFGLLRTYVVLDSALSGAEVPDRQQILDALRNGQCYIAVDSYEEASQFDFELQVDDTSFNMGSHVVFQQGAQVRVKAPSSGAVLVRLYRNGQQIVEVSAQDMVYDLSEPGVYHAEAYQARPRLFGSEEARLWIISNPIWVEE